MICRLAKTNKTKKKYAQIGLQYKLYSNPEWLMREYYHHILENPDHYQIIMCREKGRPIGCCICELIGSKKLIMVFVRKSRRRKGIGKKMVNMMKENANISDDIYADYGVVGSELFWMDVGVGLLY